MIVRLLKDVLGYSGFFSLRRLTVEHELFGGGMSVPLEREVLERSDVAAAVLYDPLLDKFVMVEQFRAGAYAAGVDSGCLTSWPAVSRPGSRPWKPSFGKSRRNPA